MNINFSNFIFKVDPDKILDRAITVYCGPDRNIYNYIMENKEKI